MLYCIGIQQRAVNSYKLEECVAREFTSPEGQLHLEPSRPLPNVEVTSHKRKMFNSGSVLLIIWHVEDKKCHKFIDIDLKLKMTRFLGDGMEICVYPHFHSLKDMAIIKNNHLHKRCATNHCGLSHSPRGQKDTAPIIDLLYLFSTPHDGLRSHGSSHPKTVPSIADAFVTCVNFKRLFVWKESSER